MTREEIISAMLEKFSEANTELAKQYGMAEEDIESNMRDAAPGLEFMFNEVYNKLEEIGALAK